MRNGTLARRGAALGTARTGGLRQALRIASAAAIAFYGLAALLELRRAGFGIRWISPTVARIGTWVLAVLLTLSALGIPFGEPMGEVHEWADCVGSRDVVPRHCA